jgi:hypothetical protein
MLLGDAVGFIVGMVLGEGLIAMLGYGDDPMSAPLWAKAIAGGVGVTVTLIAPVIGVVFGRRGMALDEGRGARTITVVHALFALATVLTNLAGLIAA